MKELQACALDMKVLTENNEEISLKDLTEEADDIVASDRDRKEEREEVELDFGDEILDDKFDSDSIFGDDLDEFDNDDDFSSKDMFDDFDDIDDFDGFDDED